MKMKHVINKFINRRTGLRRNSISAMFLFFVVLCNFAQTSHKNAYSIVGVVKDAVSKKPVSAAQIAALSEKQSAVTDEKGRFEIKLNANDGLISVSAYDYNPTETPVLGRDSIVIYLFSNEFSAYFKSMTGIYGAVTNSSTVNSIKSITNSKQTSALTADELISNRLGADVRSVTRSGYTAMGASYFIRGINTLNANAQPLFVVDGVIWSNLMDAQSIHKGFFSNPLDVIDVTDIEDISVVKDGSSIYGSKASNGVVIIKTKHATSMTTKITASVFTGITDVPSHEPMMSGEDFRIYATDMLYSKGGIKSNDLSSYAFLEQNKSNYKNYNTYHNNTNWDNEVYQNGRTSNYQINAAGGDEKAMYYISLGLTDNKGIVKNNDMSRINFRLNGDFKMFKYMDFGFNLGFTHITRNLMDDGVDQYSSPTWMSLIKSSLTNPYEYTSTGRLSTNYEKTDNFNVGNPSALLYYSDNRLKKYRFNISAAPTFKFTPKLSLSSHFDFSIDKTVEAHFTPMDFTPVEYLNGWGASLNKVTSQMMRNYNMYDETALSYISDINEFGKLKANLGMRYIDNYYESHYLEEHNTGGNNMVTITGTHDFLQKSGLNNYTKSVSSFLNVDYSYKSKYLLNAVASMDASTRFGNETKGGVNLLGKSWGVFPSINGAWIVSAEPFMKNVSLIDYLKVRAGYGITGNDGIQDYASLAYFKSVQFMSVASGLLLSNLENPALKWETTGRLNAGFDLNVLRDRLTLNFDYYWSTTNDLLVLKDLPEVSGLGKYWTNEGSLTNRGFEVAATAKMINANNFKWELGASAGHYFNEIKSLPNGQFTTDVYGGQIVAMEGQSVGSFYGFKTKGVFKTAAEALASGLKIKNADGSFSNFGAGDVIFEEDKDHADKIIDDNDRTIIGNPNPTIYGNFTNKFVYKRLTLSAICTYSYGNDVYNYKRSQLEAGSDLSNQTTALLRRWTADGQTTNQPKAVYGDPMGNARFSDRWIEDGSYFKLKSVTLSYDFPIKSDYIDGINFWISANNLFTLTKYLGSDPEFSAGNSAIYQGVDAGLIPQTKSYFVGVKLNL